MFSSHADFFFYNKGAVRAMARERDYSQKDFGRLNYFSLQT
jgi:hypothetical protein